MQKTLPLGLTFFLLLCGCQGTPSYFPAAPIDNQLVSEQPVIVMPDSRWQKAGQGGWSFRNRASLVCWMREPGETPLVLRLQPDGATAEHHFRVEWDGRELPAAQVAQSDKGLRLKLLAGQLSPGYHELRLSRDYRRDARKIRGRLPNVFPDIRYHYGDKNEVLTRQSLARRQLLTHFAQYGVIGRGKERRGGVLFVGPARHRLDLAHASQGMLLLEPRNLSGKRAVFRAAERSVTVEPGQDGRLSLELGPGTRHLDLEVEGEARGYFLWGMPRFESPAASRALPPIVLITLDTTRRDALGTYNGRSDLTPNLDRLARESTVFEQAYSTAPWTLPSHASIFTGLYPSKHGAGVSRKHLAGWPTLAELLRRRGYFAAGFSSGDLSASRFGLARGFHLYRDPDRFETPGAHLAGYLDDLLDDYAHLPLFLFVNYFDAHALYRAPEPWEEKLGVPALREKLRGQPAWEGLFASEMTNWRQFVEGKVEATPEGLEYLRAAYLAEVAYVDHLLGRLFDKLRALGLYERALIVVTSDHGELLGEGGYFSHGVRLDPELVEIPLIVKWPGQEEGRRSRRLASLIDLFPTLLGVAGVEPPANDGRLLDGASNGESPHPFLLLEEHESIVHPLPGGMKIARHLFGVQRLGFRQLVWDEGQSCSRLGGGGWQDEACTGDARSVLEAIRAQLGLVGPGEDEPAVADEVRESLEALGYM